MTNYPLLTETFLTADWAITNHADYPGYKLLGWVTSLNSILPTPSLDYSTSPGGQTHLLLPFGSSLALLQAALLHCASLQIVTKVLTLICWWFLWPYCHWNMSPLLEHSLISSTCINRLIKCDQSLKLGLLWILDLQSLTVSDLLSFIEPQNPHLCLRTHPKVC